MALPSAILRHAYKQGWTDRVSAISNAPEDKGRIRWITCDEAGQEDPAGVAEMIAEISRIRRKREEKLVAPTLLGNTCFERKETEDAVHGS